MSENYTDNLVAERARAWGEAEEVRQAAAAENRLMTAEENEKWERIAGSGGVLDQLDDQITSQRDREQRERENSTLREAVAPIVQQETREREAGDRGPDALQVWRRQGGALDIDIRAVADAKNAIRNGADEREVRDLLKVAAGSGGNTVPTTLSQQLYDFLEIYSGVRKTNVTVLTMSSGESFDMPTVASHGTAAIVGEGSALAEVDPTFGKATLTFYKYGQLLQISNELLTDTAVDITGFIALDMGRALGRVTDNAYLNGSGSNSPTGLLTVCGTATTIQTTSTGVPSYANLVDTVYSINEDYQARGASWLMRQAMAGAIRKLADTTGQPLWQPSVIAGQPDMLLGYPVYTDPNMGAVGTAASTAIVFGDFSPFVIGQVNTIRVESSSDFAFSSDLQTYRAIIRTASNLRDLTGAVKKVLEPTT